MEEINLVKDIFFSPSKAVSKKDKKIEEAKKGWDKSGEDTRKRMVDAKSFRKAGTKVVDASDCVALLEAVLRPGDRVYIEGDNQKQADFLAACLTKLDKTKVNNLHMLQSALALSDHLKVFEKGIATKVDFCYSGPVASELATMVMEGKINIGAIHTYVELLCRMYLDLIPKVSLVAANAADKNGNLYTGFNTEETPAVVEASKFRNGIVIAQVNEVVDKVPRVDIPAEWVDFVIATDEPYYIEPLFTRDPGLITESQIFIAMLSLVGIYDKYKIKTLNHGIGFNTAAVELLLPTFGEEMGMKGNICSHWALNPHPTMIPAIETGWVKTMMPFGSEVGMENYLMTKPDIFPVGPDGTMRSNRVMAQLAGHYAIDAFFGSTLQIDQYGNSAAATAGRIPGFGGAPNMACNAPGRRHPSPGWLQASKEDGMRKDLIGPIDRGRKLVVQMVETFGEGMSPVFVEKLDAFELQKQAKFAIPPVMIYADNLTHIVTEEGIAYLHKCKTLKERMDAICAIAGYTPLGMKAEESKTKKLRKDGIVSLPEDLNLSFNDAKRSKLAAKSMADLVRWSDGLYEAPTRFRNW
ncbi:MAG TPA: malonate decarboxylase subunit alpha [Methanomicrobia archaeon]|nr:malonate decarboxylase subunit alpha [Methanomicrobia archaeon]